MHAFDPNLDDDFVMVDADVSYGEVRDLVAKQLLGNGAAAFVGAHWEVTDDLALRFALKFYERLADGVAVSEAVRDARFAIRDEGDPTWLAYTVFADPGARLAAK